jgi:hypothetical protein
MTPHLRSISAVFTPTEDDAIRVVGMLGRAHDGARAMLPVSATKFLAERGLMSVEMLEPALSCAPAAPNARELNLMLANPCAVAAFIDQTWWTAFYANCPRAAAGIDNRMLMRGTVAWR